MADATRPHFEPERIPPWLVLALAAGIFASVALVLALLLLAYPQSLHRSLQGPPDPRPAPPRLQTAPAADLAALRAQEDQILSQPGWVDRDKGIARLPVEEAMQRLAAQGSPTWPAR